MAPSLPQRRTKTKRKGSLGLISDKDRLGLSAAGGANANANANANGNGNGNRAPPSSTPSSTSSTSTSTSSNAAAMKSSTKESGEIEQVNAENPATKQKALVDTISKACAYGDLTRLKELLSGEANTNNSNNSGSSIVELPASGGLGGGGYEALGKPDAEGYYPLQWAALNNQVECMTYLLEDVQCRKHVDLNAKDVNTGQTALHWAAVRGCISVMKILSDFEAKMSVKDNKGYTAAHVAAQYGQTDFLYFMKMRCKVDIVSCLDNDLRSTLHWACYQGHGDTTKLLLFLGSDLLHSDREKCTPLHWAAIKGNGHITHMLIQSASLCEAEHVKSTGMGGGALSLKKERYVDLREDYILAKDSTGSNAIELAKQKGHLFVSGQMEAQLKKLQSWTRTNKVAKYVFKLEFLPILTLVIVAMLVSYTRTIVFIDESGENAPATASSVFWAFTVLIPSIVGLGVLYHCSKRDPGFLRTGQVRTSKSQMSSEPVNGKGGGESEEDMLLLKNNVHTNGFGSEAGGDFNGDVEGKEITVDLDNIYMDQELDSPALWAGNWNQICPTCRIVKPLRAKHDAFSNRCVENFDHHCPWVANAIGKQNRWHFVVFLTLQMWALVVSLSVAVYKLTKLKPASSNSPFVVSFLVFDCSLSISVLTLLVTQLSSIAKNLTTNELANQHRYTYLGMDSHGRILNPFDRGTVYDNCLEVIHPQTAKNIYHLTMADIQKLAPKRAPPCCRGNQKCGVPHRRGDVENALV